MLASNCTLTNFKDLQLVSVFSKFLLFLVSSVACEGKGKCFCSYILSILMPVDRLIEMPRDLLEERTERSPLLYSSF